MAHQQVGGVSQSRIGSDARIPIGPTALHADGQITHRSRAANGFVGDIGNAFKLGQRLFNRPSGPALLLDRHVSEGTVGADWPAADKIGHLHNLTPKANQQNSRKIRMLRITRQRPEKSGVSFVDPGHAASGAMDNRNDAIDIGKPVQKPGLFRRFRNKTGNGTRAVYRGENADIVAGSSPAVRTPVALKCSFVIDGSQRRVLGGKLMVLETVVFHSKIV